MISNDSACFICIAYVCVSLSQNSLLPSKVGKGVHPTLNANYSTPFLCRHEETATERCHRGASAGKCRPFGFLRIGIYVLGFV